jgi:hypothetical protein
MEVEIDAFLVAKRLRTYSLTLLLTNGVVFKKDFMQQGD